MQSKFFIKQNDKGHWQVTIFKQIDNKLQIVNRLYCIDISALCEVLDMLTGSQSIILEDAS